jgi:hypothetical protein
MRREERIHPKQFIFFEDPSTTGGPSSVGCIMPAIFEWLYGDIAGITAGMIDDCLPQR